MFAALRKVREETGNAGVSPAMSAERNEVECSANTACAAEILREVVVATGLFALHCAALRSRSLQAGRLRSQGTSRLCLAKGVAIKNPLIVSAEAV